MTRIEKILSRFYSIPKDFTWDELLQVLNKMGYEEVAKGKTGGSRRKFTNALKQIIILHKPHPQNTVKEYSLKQVIEALENHRKIAESKPVERKVEPFKKTRKNRKNE